MIALRDGLVLIALTALALLLALLPMPEPIMALRPAWPLLVLSAWAMQRDPMAVLPLALAAGLMLDAVRGVTLGLHGAALLLPLAAALHWRTALRAMPLWQASIAAGGLFLLQALLLSLLDALTGEHSLRSAHWWAVPVSVLLWPLAVLLLRPAPAAKSPG
jgi:rod shape-determining protein MreD